MPQAAQDTEKVICSFSVLGTLRALAHGGSLPFFVRVFFIINLPNLGVSIIDTPKFGSSSLFCV